MEWTKTSKGYFAVERAKDTVWLHFTKNPKNISWDMQQFTGKTEADAIKFENRIKAKMAELKI